MSSSFGSTITYTLFGESHSPAIGITIQGLPAGFTFDFEQIHAVLDLRRGGKVFNTTRSERDTYDILSGYFNDQTTGSPLTIIFPNSDVQSKDYRQFGDQPRPGHADHVAATKYNEANDYRGGGHFSGRITTPLVFFGAMARQLIQAQYPAFAIHSHIKQLHNIKDTNYYDLRRQMIDAIFNADHADSLLDSYTVSQTHNSATINEKYTTVMANIQTIFSQTDKSFPLLDNDKKRQMVSLLAHIVESQSSIGGNIETVVFQPPLSLGEPFFHSVESIISSLLFSIGSVKGVTFGYGHDFITATGVEVKDEIIQISDDKISTLYNYNGGINGGITNGEDIVISTTLKPISSIQALQHTFHTGTKKIEPLSVNGRHDATIINRVIPVIESVVAIALYDLIRTHSQQAK